MGIRYSSWVSGLRKKRYEKRLLRYQFSKQTQVWKFERKDAGGKIKKRMKERQKTKAYHPHIRGGRWIACCPPRFSRVFRSAAASASPRTLGRISCAASSHHRWLLEDTCFLLSNHFSANLLQEFCKPLANVLKHFWKWRNMFIIIPKKRYGIPQPREELLNNLTKFCKIVFPSLQLNIWINCAGFTQKLCTRSEKSQNYKTTKTIL